MGLKRIRFVSLIRIKLCIIWYTFYVIELYVVGAVHKVRHAKFVVSLLVTQKVWTPNIFYHARSNSKASRTLWTSKFLDFSKFIFLSTFSAYLSRYFVTHNSLGIDKFGQCIIAHVRTTYTLIISNVMIMKNYKTRQWQCKNSYQYD